MRLKFRPALRWAALACAAFVAAQAAQSAGAVSYTDTGSFQTNAGRTAVRVLGELGVVNGYPDGSFRPGSPVTRAEFAKMICIAKTGGTSVPFYQGADLSGVFRDVPADHWADAYIAYCYYTGIAAGDGNGRFRPEDGVTSAEAAKMLLAALGYDPAREGLTGPNYAAAASRLAQSNGLLANYGAGLSDAAGREDAAILLYNGLYADTVTYIGGAAVPRTGALASTDTITLAEEGFDLLDVTAVLVANGGLGLGMYEKTAVSGGVGAYRRYGATPDGQSRFVFRTENNDSQGSYAYTALTVRLDTDFDMLGRAYRLLVTKQVDAAGLRNLYGAPITSGLREVRTTSAARTAPGLVEEMAGYRKAAGGGGSDSSADPGSVRDGTVFVNGREVSYDEARAALGVATTAPVAAVYEDGRPVCLFIASYRLTGVLAADGASVTLAGEGQIDRAKLAGGDDTTIAAQDTVVYWKNAANGVYSVKKLSGTVDNVAGYRAADASYLIGGVYCRKGALLSADGSALMGTGLSAVRDTKLAYRFDEDASDRFIASAAVDAATKYAHYGLFLWADTDVKSYERIVVKFMKDGGETLYAELEDVNGYTAAPANFANSFTEGLVFGYALDARGRLHIRTVDELDSTADFSYSRLSDTLSNGTNGGTYLHSRGVLFVTYGQPAVGSEESFVWRAYGGGDFHPSGAHADEAAHASNTLTSVDPERQMPDRVKANRLGGAYDIEAASVSFNDYAAYGYVLPGLSVGPNERLATVLSVDGRLEGGQYRYTYTIAGKNGSGTEQLESVGFDAPYRVPETGYIYRCALDGDGRVVSLADYGVNSGGENNGIEKAAYQVDSFFRAADGKYQIVAKQLIASDGKPKLDSVTVTLDPARTSLYYVDGLFTPSAAMWDPATLPLPGEGVAALADVRLWLDYNESDGTLYNVWADAKPDAAYLDTVLTDIRPDEVRYDTAQGVWTYTFAGNAIGTLTFSGGPGSGGNLPAGAAAAMTFRNGELAAVAYGEIVRISGTAITASYSAATRSLQLSGGEIAGSYVLADPATLFRVAADGSASAVDENELESMADGLGTAFDKLELLRHPQGGLVYSLVFYEPQA